MLVNVFSNIISCQGTEGPKNTELTNHQHLSAAEIDTNPSNMDGDGIEMSHGENDDITREETKLARDEHTDRETTDRAHQQEDDANETDSRVGSGCFFYAGISNGNRTEFSQKFILQYSDAGKFGL